MSGVADVRATIAGAREWLDRGGAADGPLHRRDPPLQQGPAGRAAAAGRGRHRHAHRRDHREPLLRGQLGAASAGLRVFRLEPLDGRPRCATVVERRDDRRARLRRPRSALAPDGARAPRRHQRRRRARRRSTSSRRAGRHQRGPDGTDSPTLEAIETAAQQRVLAYDRAGDGHYDTVSAFIKSIRGNDPDAALYWLASMLAAGEDPRFIARRLIILASEDVGNADPRGPRGRRRRRPGARLGRPARGAVRPRPGDRLPRRGAEVEPRRAWPTGRPWPTSSSEARCRCRCTCATRRSRGCARTASASATATRTTTRAADVDQQYLPDALADRRYYVPGDQGLEPRIGERLDRLRAEREAAGGAGGRKRSKSGLPSVDPMRTAGGRHEGPPGRQETAGGPCRRRVGDLDSAAPADRWVPMALVRRHRGADARRHAGDIEAWPTPWPPGPHRVTGEPDPPAAGEGHGTLPR